MTSFTVFETPLGWAGLVWTAAGVREVHLPEPERGALEARLAGRGRASRPPAGVRALAQRIVRHLEGEPQSFADAALDLAAVPPFHARVYEAARAVPAGTLATYGELAGRLGSPGAARAVGQALARNPLPLVVPCHRIVAAGGRPGGFSAPGGLVTKGELLRLEGVDRNGAGWKPRRIPSLWDDGAVEEGLRFLRRADKRLAKVLSAVGPCTLSAPKDPDCFRALCEAIVYQQLAGSAASAIFGRFVKLFRGGPTPRKVLSTAETTLRGAGLSGPKIAALRALSQAVVDGTVDVKALPSLPDEEVHAQLGRVKGIGPWTAQMLLLFHLGRTDVLPVGDLGIRKAIQRLYGLDGMPSPREIEELAASWRPWRTLASWYLWRSLGAVTISAQGSSGADRRP